MFAAWPPARNDVKHSLDQANEHHEQAAGGRVNKAEALQGCAEKRASSPTTDAQHGQATKSVLTDKDIALLVARCRQHFTTFQELVFVQFSAALPDLAKPELAAWVATFDDALATLDTLETIEGHSNDNANAYRADYGWMKDAWDTIVIHMGLSTDDYATVREFKKYSDGDIFLDILDILDILDTYEEPEQALRVLESSTVPVELQKYRQPLINLLGCLVKLRSTGPH